MLWQRSDWRRTCEDETLDKEGLQGAQNRHKRRMQVATLIAFAAAAFFFGQWIDLAHPAAGAYWLGVMALVLWMLTLAMIDAATSIYSLRRLLLEQTVARARLEAEAKVLLREAKRNKD